jgi:hypothetical protein
MEERRRGHEEPREAATTDASAYCPNCGRPGEWRKCKLLCTNPKCSVHIILACVD